MVTMTSQNSGIEVSFLDTATELCIDRGYLRLLGRSASQPLTRDSFSGTAQVIASVRSVRCLVRVVPYGDLLLVQGA